MNSRDIGFMTANPKSYNRLKEFKKELIGNQTEAELILWRLLRNKAIGHKIRRQHIIDDYIADLICLQKKVIIEIDSDIHLQQQDYDEGRTAELNKLGFEIIRFSNKEVIENSGLVIDRIKKFLDNKLIE